ncbi:ABC transporter permease [Kocuria sp. M1R5S2]|uniref:ABC transporter permease n=1 Tax=Kocuria rhizosphaerae TaxID=3376285 RepID=UPI0037888CDB
MTTTTQSSVTPTAALRSRTHREERARGRRSTSVPAGDQYRSRLRPFLRQLALRLIVPVLLLAAWWAASQSAVAGMVVADPASSFGRFVEEFVVGSSTAEHLLPSVGRALSGLLLAVVAGVLIGVLLGSSRILAALFQPLVHLGRSLPSAALIGVFFFVFGIGDYPKIFLIAFTVVWPILLNTMDGVSSIGEVRSQAARVFRIPARDVFTHIVLPGAAPKIFAGVRTSMSLALIIMIISELQKSDNGLGYQLVSYQRIFDFEGFWSVLIVLAIVGVLFNVVFTTIERRILAWHRGATAQND